jgi:hypothetical protein
MAGGYPIITYEGTVISGDPSLFRERNEAERRPIIAQRQMGSPISSYTRYRPPTLRHCSVYTWQFRLLVFCLFGLSLYEGLYSSGAFPSGSVAQYSAASCPTMCRDYAGSTTGNPQRNRGTLRAGAHLDSQASWRDISPNQQAFLLLMDHCSDRYLRTFVGSAGVFISPSHLVGDLRIFTRKTARRKKRRPCFQI